MHFPAKSLLAATALVALSGASTVNAQTDITPWPNTEVIEVPIKGKTLIVTVVDDIQLVSEQDALTKKLNSLLANEGVLLVFGLGSGNELCVAGIKDDRYPDLSVAFLDESFLIQTVGNTGDDDADKACAFNVKQVLLMPDHWFERNGVMEGDRYTAFKPASAARRKQIIAQWQQSPAQSAARSVKDVGMFGNFELDSGFGEQKATGLAGRVVGITDGLPNPNSLRALGAKRQTLEGEEYAINMLGNCDPDSMHNSKATRPSHRIMVASPVVVKFRLNHGRHETDSTNYLALYGQDLQACLSVPAKLRSGDFVLELLPGDYEVYVEGENAQDYTLTLTEQVEAITHLAITAGPGFKPIQATGIALDASYHKSPVARPHELTVTAPLVMELTAELDTPELGTSNYAVSPFNITVKGEQKTYVQRSKRGYDSDRRVRLNIAKMVMPFEPGQYQLYVDYDQFEGISSTKPYRLTLQENTEIKTQQHIILDKAFKRTAFESVWKFDASNPALDWLKNCDIPNAQELTLSVPHKLTVTAPGLVKIIWITDAYWENRSISWDDFEQENRDKQRLILRSTSGEKRIFCENKESLLEYRHALKGNDSDYDLPTVNLEAFLVPGEYELYVSNPRTGAMPFFYEMHLTR